MHIRSAAAHGFSIVGEIGVWGVASPTPHIIDGFPGLYQAAQARKAISNCPDRVKAPDFGKALAAAALW